MLKRQFMFGSLVSLGLLALGCEAAPPADQAVTVPLVGSGDIDEDEGPSGAYLPIWQMAQELNEAPALDTELMALTPPPPAPVDARPEWASLEGTLLRWPIGWPQMKPTYLAMLPPLQSEGKVYITVNNRKARDEAIRDINGCAACSLNNVVWVETRTDGIWMRDFGPEFIYSEGDALGIIDLDYYYTRPNDDAFPVNYANLYGLPSYTPGLLFEGGNFQVDDEGRCFASRGVLLQNTEAKVRDVFAQYLGCTETHLIPYLLEEGTHHIDMWMKFVGNNTVLVGDYNYYGNEQLVYPDTDNDVILEQVVTQMAGLGFNVVRIPQPASYYYASFGAYTIRTYTNSTMANNKVLVPIYLEATDADALAIYESVLPSAVQAVGIDSRYIIDYGGAMHCISMERHPVLTAPNQPPVADLAPASIRVAPGTTVTFDASGSYDPDGQPLTYTWSWGDGTAGLTTNNPIVTHLYATKGRFTCTVTVSDGSLSASDTSAVTVR